MCGIAGIIGNNDRTQLTGMLRRIVHRGPDCTGFKQFSDTIIGNVRLSIIDIDGGKQPIPGPGNNTWVVLNGELYNYFKTRSYYSNKGYPFSTRTDTEILLPLYDEYGLDLFKKLNGMFSFCLHDEKNETIVIARDHFGIKPLLYTIHDNCLYFSSEIKSFYAIPGWQARPDMDAWHTFLNIRFPPPPRTLFQDVSKLPPGCYIILHRKHSSISVPRDHQKLQSLSCGDWQGAIYRYYQLPQETTSLSFDDSIARATALFQNSIDSQMIADVPVGVYLSGGIDSSTVTAFASQFGKRGINTFCLGFGEPTDENDDARLTADFFNTNHVDITLNVNPLDQFKNAVYHMEEPKVNCLQGFILAKEAVKHQKVVLSGLGGDELFGGYDIYAIGVFLDQFRKKPFSPAVRCAGSIFNSLCRLNNGLKYDLYRRGSSLLRQIDNPLNLYILLRNGWDHDGDLLRSIYRKGFYENNISPVYKHFEASFPDSHSLADSFMRFEFQNKMVDDFLANEDRMSMAASLESRVPFLDKHLVEFAFSLPVTWKIRRNRRKIFLKTLLAEKLPEHILSKKKQGFTFNPVLQAQKDLIPLARKYLTPERVEDSGIFNFQYLNKIMTAAPHPNLRWHYFLLWKILGYHIWEDIFIRNPGLPPEPETV